MAFETISTIGMGYIGLPTAAAFAAAGKKVIGVDINQAAVDTINQGKIHIVEPDLDDVVKTAVATGHLRATTVPEAADAFLIAVPTPFKGDHEPDVSYVETAVRSIAPVLKQGDLVILESTSPVGTTEDVAQWLSEERPDLIPPPFNIQNPVLNINLAYCPERVLPGKIMQELVNNDRVIGGITPRCSERAIELYKTFVKGECIPTTARTAEMCKLTENSFRDVNIAFANELSIICDKLDINVWELIKLANRHPRVNILQPGPGVGGHCIAVDPWFIVSKTPNESHLIRTAREVNNYKTEWVIEKIKNEALIFEHNNRKKPIIACFGLAFKADIDDLRESPALNIVKKLVQENLHILAIEPNLPVKTNPSDIGIQHGNFNFSSIEKGVKYSDIIVKLVAHKEFNKLTNEEALILDFCN